VTDVALNRAAILAGIGQPIAPGVADHESVGMERQTRFLGRPDHRTGPSAEKHRYFNVWLTLAYPR
jgi:hypothetical protein